MRSLLEEGSDREAVLSRFVSELSEQEEQLLHDLLSAHEGHHGAGTGDGRK
jgi:hypothetical protein